VALDYATARQRALSALCSDIRVVVQSESTDERVQLLRQTRTADGRKLDEMFYNELTRIVSKTSSHCVFEGMKFVEKREEIGGKSFVLLRMGIREYVRYMAGRIVTVGVDMGDNALSGDGLVSALSDHLRMRGYVVAVAGNAAARFAASAVFRPEVEETAGDFGNLVVGSAEVTYTLKKLSDGTEVEREHIPASEVKVRKFSTENALKGLEVEAVKVLKKKLGEKR